MGVSVSHTALANNWIATSNNNCKAYNPNPIPNETATWSGECKDGYVHGQGTLQWYENGKPIDSYVGNYNQGKQHGKGVYTWANGSKYDGEHKDGERHGLGKLTLVKGDNATASYGNKGEWQGNTYVVQGEFVNGEHTLQCEPNQKACDKARAEQEKQEQERREREYKASVEACKSRYVGERLRLKAPYSVSSFIFFSSTKYEYLPFKVVRVGKDKMTVEAVYDGGIIGDISSANIPCNATSVR